MSRMELAPRDGDLIVTKGPTTWHLARLHDEADMGDKLETLGVYATEGGASGRAMMLRRGRQAVWRCDFPAGQVGNRWTRIVNRRGNRERDH